MWKLKVATMRNSIHTPEPLKTPPRSWTRALQAIQQWLKESDKHYVHVEFVPNKEPYAFNPKPTFYPTEFAIIEFHKEIQQ